MDACRQQRPAREADEIASRIRLNPEFAQKLADELKPGTTVIVTDEPVVRKPTRLHLFRSQLKTTTRNG